MCFDLDSHPPITPIAGGALDSKRLTLRSADGSEVAAFRARAAHPTSAGIVILPDARGLHRYYEELALRFAEAGIDALAIDYFGRTAGVTPRDDSFEYLPHLGQTKWAQLAADIEAAAQAIARRELKLTEFAGSHITRNDWRKEQNAAGPIEFSHRVTLFTSWRKELA